MLKNHGTVLHVSVLYLFKHILRYYHSAVDKFYVSHDAICKVKGDEKKNPIS